MATIAKKRKSTRRRKPGASKAPGRKRKARVGKSASSTVKIGGETFTKRACSLTKTDAQKRAANYRAKGKRARTFRNTNGKGYCVATRG